MKLNWGHKLTILTVVFMLFIITLVTYMIKQNVELVDSDYYEKGIKYQEVIDASADAGKWVSMELISEPSLALKITSLDSSNLEAISGTLLFYRPSDKTKDFQTEVSFSNKTPFSFPVITLQKGVWKATLIWTDSHGKHQLVKDLTL